MDNTLQTVTVALAITTAVGPILFGFIMWKMFANFPTRREYDEHKLLMERDRAEMKQEINWLKKKVYDLCVKCEIEDT